MLISQGTDWSQVPLLVLPQTYQQRSQACNSWATWALLAARQAWWVYCPPSTAIYITDKYWLSKGSKATLSTAHSAGQVPARGHPAGWQGARAFLPHTLQGQLSPGKSWERGRLPENTYGVKTQ